MKSKSVVSFSPYCPNSIINLKQTKRLYALSRAPSSCYDLRRTEPAQISFVGKAGSGISMELVSLIPEICISVGISLSLFCNETWAPSNGHMARDY